MPFSGQVTKPFVELGAKPGDCWKWLGTHNSLGYASKTENGKTTTGQRWLFEKLFGTLPACLTVRMTCGDRLCVNPHHMVIVTLTEAQREGSNAALLPADVQEIKRAKKGRTPLTARHLAAKYGCSEQAIRDIWRGRTWKAPKADAHPYARAVETPSIQAGTTG